MLLVVLLAAGSASTTLGPLVVVARIPAEPNATLFVSGTQAVVVEIRDGHNEISAYGLDDGVRHWTTRLTVLAVDVYVRTLHGTVLVGFASPGVTGDHTDAIDLRTGALRWHSKGTPVATLPDNDTVLLTSPLSVDTDRLELVDRATGVPRWSATIGDDCAHAISDDMSRVSELGLVELCGGTDDLRVFDLRTGRVRAARPINLDGLATGSRPHGGAFASFQLWLFGDVIVVQHDDSPTSVLDAYRASDLTELWSGRPIAGGAGLDRCGVDICLSQGAGLIMLDPHSGVALMAGSVPNPSTGNAPSGPVLVDGRATFVLLPANARPDGRGVFATADFVTTVTDGTAVQIPDAAAGDTWVATRSVKSGPAGTRLVVTPIELLHGIRADSCLILDSYLACATRDNRLTFWQLPSGR